MDDLNITSEDINGVTLTQESLSVRFEMDEHFWGDQFLPFFFQEVDQRDEGVLLC